MSALIYCQNLTKSYGAKRLFHNLTIGVFAKDRLGIIGPNGSGKSTLMKILAGLEQADQGTVTRRQHLRVAYIPQQSEFDPEATVVEEVERAAVASGLAADEIAAWVQETLGRIGFEKGSQTVGSLSGGWAKRLAIACGFVQNPDVMLLDEPMNHLDLEGMRWLEQLMSQAPWAWLIVSHDRWFLERATNKVAELNNRYADGIFLVTGRYSDFIIKREEYQNAQTQQAQALSAKVRREVEWLRRGPKARATKAKSRIDTAHALQAELAEITARLSQEESSVDFVGSGRKTKRLVVVEHLSKAFGQSPLIQDLDLVLSPGMALGVLGRNGSGKSTLLKLLAQALEPDRGTVTHADSLQVVYFDQNREQLDPKVTLRDTLSDTGPYVTYRDRSIPLVSWAKRFHFNPEQLDLPVGLLSGGEQARAVIARLMLQPADVLILDEPTNDLDIPTLEVLEESLQEFPGALVLVTHDRYVLTQVCTLFVGLDGTGTQGRFADYDQWEAWIHNQPAHGNPEREPVSKQPPSQSVRPRRLSSKRLTYREQQEYTTIEEQILAAEAELKTCRAQMEDPTIATQHLQLHNVYVAFEAAEQEVERLYARWAELENKLQENH
jgi:ATP-binding cassette subfamily F protein uup